MKEGRKERGMEGGKERGGKGVGKERGKGGKKEGRREGRKKGGEGGGKGRKRKGWMAARPLCLATLPLPRLPADGRQRLAAAGWAGRQGEVT